jgi:multiple sugar transport system permease protein
MLNNVLYLLFGIDGPIYLNDHWTALASNIGAYIWKTMPFWTIILLAGRMAIPQELYEAAVVDGATGLRRFAYVTVPLMANLYVVCVLLDTICTLGDFNSTYFVSGGGPAMTTEVLATLAIRYAFTTALPPLGVATVMTALPMLIPLVIILMRKLRMNEVQL